MQGRVSFHNLNPISFLERIAQVYPNKPAVMYRDQTYTYAQLYDRVNRLAGALQRAGVHKGDRVAFLVPNLPSMLEGHYGPLRLGAILVSLNVRLSPGEIDRSIKNQRRNNERIHTKPSRMGR